MPGPTFIELADHENQLSREFDQALEAAVATYLRGGGSLEGMRQLLTTWPERYIRMRQSRPRQA